MNTRLRQEIDSLRRERVVFDQLYKKMEKELTRKKNRMAEIIETANAAYEQRDTANETLGKGTEKVTEEQMKEEAKNEAREFENELKELSLMNEKSKQSVEFNMLRGKRTNGKNYGFKEGFHEMDANMKSGAQKLLKERAVDQKLLEKHRWR